MLEGKAQKGGLVLLGFGILDKMLDLWATAGGIHADSPGLFKWAQGVMSGAFEFLGFSGIAIIVGAGMFAWGRWGDRVRQWLPISVRNVSSRSALATHDDLVQLAHAIADSSDFASRIAKLSRETAVHEMRRILLQDITPKLSDAMEKLDDIRSALDQSHRDISVLLYYSLYDLNLRTLRDLLDVAPEVGIYYEQEAISTEWLHEQQTIAVAFVEQTEKALRYTPRYDRLRSVLQNAESEADREVRQIPIDRRPIDIDHLDLRVYRISVKKLELVIAFLKQEEADMTERTAAQREAIQERYSLRNPQA